MTAFHLITHPSLGGPAQHAVDSVVALDRAGFAQVRLSNAPLVGANHASGGGAVEWTVARASIGAEAALTDHHLLLSLSLLAFAEREVG